MTRSGAPVLVLVPTYDEADTIGDVIDGVLASTEDADVLVIDDASPDGTGAIVERRSAVDERVHVLHRGAKRGLGSAYRDGFSWGLDRGYRVLVEMDADLSHDPAHLPALIGATSTADLVIGSRYVPGGGTRNWPWTRQVLSRAGNRYVAVVTGVPARDATSGFRAYRREVLEELGVQSLRSEGYAFQVEGVLRTWRAGFAVAEVPITFVERREGTSKISRAIVVEAIWRVLVWGLRARRATPRRHPRSVRARAPGIGPDAVG